MWREKIGFQKQNNSILMPSFKKCSRIAIREMVHAPVQITAKLISARIHFSLTTAGFKIE